ncbi:MAG: hypothetical protein JXR68_10900 [Bacteroidales bacterium]|nr:hypothetical protein [Bacteroidales bacterium]
MTIIKPVFIVLFLVFSNSVFAISDGTPPVIVYKLSDYIDTTSQYYDLQTPNHTKAANQLIVVEFIYSLTDGWITKIDDDIKINPQIKINADELKNLDNINEINLYSPNKQDFIYAQKTNNDMIVNFVFFCSNGSSFAKMIKNSFYWSFQIQEITSDFLN